MERKSQGTNRMSNRWKTIWQKKRFEGGTKAHLSELIKLDGFDAFGRLDEATWIDYVTGVCETLGLGEEETVFEVGCGAGAFLYPIYQMGHQVGGCDYAENLVGVAQKAMPQGNFQVAEAARFEVKEAFDVAISNGVFLYYPNHEYAARALLRMIRIAKKSIAILDVPDLKLRDTALALRKGHLGEKKYAAKYEGLDHLYYSREWFQETLKDSGVEIRMVDQAIPGYLHNAYRYNVFVSKVQPEAGNNPTRLAKGS